MAVQNAQTANPARSAESPNPSGLAFPNLRRRGSRVKPMWKKISYFQTSRQFMSARAGVNVQRPVMNPSFVHEGPAPVRRWYHRLRPIWRVIAWFLGLFVRDMFYKRRGLRIDVGTRSSRFFRGLCYRLGFAPLILALVARALLFTRTHPPAAASS